MDGTSDEGVRSLQKKLDRLQDELMSADPRQKRRDDVILKDIDYYEKLLDNAERSGDDPDDTSQVATPRPGEVWES